MTTQHLPKTQAWLTQAVRTKLGREMQPSRTIDGQAHLLETKIIYTCYYKCEALRAGLLRLDNV